MKFGRYQVHLNPIALIVVILGVGFLAKLGFWQLDRAEQKAAILAEIHERQTNQPLSLSALNQQQDKAYYQVRLQGQFLEEPIFLLDNRIVNSRPGFEVLQVLQTEQQQLLVNRGWIPLPRERSQLPDISTPKGIQNITGEVNYPTEAIVLREDDLTKINQWPAVIQAIDITALQNILAAKSIEISPYVIRQTGEDNFYTRQWINVNMPPERHISYAVTWFGLAIALIIIYIAAATRKE